MGNKTEIPNSYRDDWIDRLDGRTNLARAVKDRLGALEGDLGGRDGMSYQQRSLAKRAVWQEVLIEQRESALARGEAVDVGPLIQATNSLVGLFKTLGLDRKQRDVPSLHDYLNRHEGQQ